MNGLRMVPIQPVSNLSASIAFYEKNGFVVEERNIHWGWARLVSGACTIMLDTSIHEKSAFPGAAVLYLYPENIAEFHGRARGRGLEVAEPAPNFYGMTEFRIEDPDGNRLWIGQRTDDAGGEKS